MTETTKGLEKVIKDIQAKYKELDKKEAERLPEKKGAMTPQERERRMGKPKPEWVGKIGTLWLGAAVIPLFGAMLPTIGILPRVLFGLSTA
jgi:hypothetical protein